MANLLVTGGAGYVGSHALRALLRAGHSAVVLDDLRAGCTDFAAGVPLVERDVADRDAALVLKNALPRGAVTATTPQAAGRRRCVDGPSITRRDLEVEDATTEGRGADLPPFQVVHDRGLQPLAGCAERAGD